MDHLQRVYYKKIHILKSVAKNMTRKKSYIIFKQNEVH